jgi:hypothetical protein
MAKHPSAERRRRRPHRQRHAERVVDAADQRRPPLPTGFGASLAFLLVDAGLSIQRSRTASKTRFV